MNNNKFDSLLHFHQKKKLRESSYLTNVHLDQKVLNKLNYEFSLFRSNTIPALKLLNSGDIMDWRNSSRKNVKKISKEFRFLALFDPNDFARVKTRSMLELKKSFNLVNTTLKHLDDTWTKRKNTLFQFYKSYKIMDHNLEVLNFDIDKQKLLESESLVVINEVTFKVDSMAKILKELKEMHSLQYENLNGFQQIGKRKRSRGNFHDGISHRSGITSSRNGSKDGQEARITEVIKNLEGAVSFQLQCILIDSNFLLGTLDISTVRESNGNN